MICNSILVNLLTRLRIESFKNRRNDFESYGPYDMAHDMGRDIAYGPYDMVNLNLPLTQTRLNDTYFMRYILKTKSVFDCI